MLLLVVTTSRVPATTGVDGHALVDAIAVELYL